jgi:hypothetical protein
MRKYFGVFAALLLLVAPVAAQDVQRVPLAIAWDMDGEAGVLTGNDDQIVLSSNLVDSKTHTVTASPDTCRVVDISVTDANSSISAGVLTITGTDCWGDTLTCTFTFASGGSGVKPLVYGTGSGLTCAFATITSVINGLLTGEDVPGTDLLKVGYTANPPITYPIYGIRKEAGGKRYVDPFLREMGKGTITVNGTAVASFATADGGAFQNLAVGDLVYIVTDGQTFERRLTTVTDDDTAVIDVAIPTNSAPATTAEIRFFYKKFFKFVETNEAWVPVQRGREAAFFIFDVDANANTGGVTTSIECAVFSAFSSGNYDPNVQVDTDNVATGATGQATTAIDLSLAPYTHCRGGISFGTGDDGDGAVEDLNLYLMITRRN